MNGLPVEWLPSVSKRLKSTGLPVRFTPDVEFELERLAAFHDCSMAAIVRSLVDRGLTEARRRKSA